MGRHGWTLTAAGVALLAASSVLIAATHRAHAAGEARAASDAPHAAVVELFTSEGCSSCPPADAVLERIGAASRASGRPVITLAFHVDYWDDLGWPDTFASPDFTARQRDYAGVFHGSGLYTPEMVVGGRDAFVGSDETRAEASVASALAQPLPVRVALRVTRTSPTEIRVHHTLVGSLPRDATLLLAVTERAATIDVKNGENAGRRLHHTDIVRATRASTVRDANGDDTVRLPWAPGPAEADVAAIVQRGDGTMAVLGAAREEVPR
ncbi:MAG TPA: DUF1223 domain-containing protein [Polyangiaceae bacterium]|jgi:hypothetical protein|nr:DUF1223 domain-containing protein [Polyangiaceae bacterium]